MMIRAILISLSLTVPAHAATVALDPGDAGLHWIEGVGFRPVDGIDLWLSKYDCPRVGASWKDAATDRVGRETQCNEPPSGGDGERHNGFVDLTDQPSTRYLPSAARLKCGVAPQAKPKTRVGLTEVWQDYIPYAIGKVGDRQHITTPSDSRSSDRPALDPPPAPVPLPASVWLMLAALAMLWRIRA